MLHGPHATALERLPISPCMSLNYASRYYVHDPAIPVQSPSQVTASTLLSVAIKFNQTLFRCLRPYHTESYPGPLGQPHSGVTRHRSGPTRHYSGGHYVLQVLYTYMRAECMWYAKLLACYTRAFVKLPLVDTVFASSSFIPSVYE